MTHHLSIENEADIKWLQAIIVKLSNPNTNSATFLAANHKYLKAWERYLSEAVVDFVPPQQEPPKRRGRPASEVKQAPKKKSAKRVPKADRVNHFGCDAHPTYGVKYSPRSNCDRCWELYKKFHPMEYTQARRKFDLKQRLLAKET